MKLPNWWDMKPGEEFRMGIREYFALADHQRERMDRVDVRGASVIVKMKAPDVTK